MRFDHYHHYPELRERLEDIILLLTSLQRTNKMLTQEVQDLMAQAEKNVSITASLDAGFKSLTLQIATLQAQVTALQGNGVITEAEKQQIVNTTNDLAASFSTLAQDIPANTPAAPPATDPTPAPVDPAPVDPNAPTTGT